MSGHSKWSTIKRQKGANDAKRGQMFTKLSNAITLAVRTGGGIADPASNFKLRLAVEAARSANMPKENIERAISRASGKQDSSMEEVVYEGFGPGGFAVIVDAITDNKLRTTPVVKNLFEKNGGSIGTPGSVSYQFQTAGLIILSKEGKSFDELFEAAVDAGAEDVEDAEEEVLIYTKPDQLATVRDALLEKNFSVTKAELTRKPTHSVSLADQAAAQRALDFVEKLEDLDDVQQVYANFSVDDSMLAA